MDRLGLRANGRMAALDLAIRELLPSLMILMNQRYHHYSPCLRTIAFSEGASWAVSSPTPVGNYVHPDLSASDSTADLGAALHLLAKELEIPPMSSRSPAPVLVVATGGVPTEGWRSGLRALNNRCAQRLHLRIGQDPVATRAISYDGSRFHGRSRESPRIRRCLVKLRGGPGDGNRIHAMGVRVFDGSPSPRSMCRVTFNTVT
jgi:hypothetical protein